MKSQRRKVPGVELIKPRHKQSIQTPALFQRPAEPTKEELAAFRQAIGAVHAAIAAARPTRFDTPQNWRAWEEAIEQKYALYKEHVPLPAQHFSREIISPEVACYDWDFWRDMELLKGGDQSKLEQAVAFLEDDPWFYGSGYDKVRLVRYIKLPMLTPSYIGRLQSVVLRMVETRNGTDFGAFCRLARKVDDADLREQLTQRLDGGDVDIRRRARWVLEALAQKDSMEQGRKTE